MVKKKNVSLSYAYKRGGLAAFNLIKYAIDCKIFHLTLYAFSIENWKRPKFIIDMLFLIFSRYVPSMMDFCTKNNVRVKFIGEIDFFPDYIKDYFKIIENHTSENGRILLSIAVSYGAKEELVNCIKNIVKNEIKISNINYKLINSFFYTKNTPNPDLLIRTSGEKRLSNFLLIQSAYTELYFSDVLWPDFKKEHLLVAIDDFKRRNRRYGE